MIIQGKRINRCSRYFSSVPDETPILIARSVGDIDAPTLARIGFPIPCEENFAVLPAPVFGPVSRYNANGKEVPDRSLPMETVSRWVYSTWTDWHGNEHSGFVLRYYNRYPRRNFPPPSVEIRVSADVSGNLFLTTEAFNHSSNRQDATLHRVNLFLEIFGICEVLTENLERIIVAPVRKVNWRLLPAGQNPFDQLLTQLDEIVSRTDPGYREAVLERAELINSFGPSQIVIGQGGFREYVVYRFPDRGLNFLESVFRGNATYVFGDDWEHLSQLTKAEIIAGGLAIERIVHGNDWRPRIQRYFRP
ncbi:hypothetical protein TSACC_3326 [Terrimicrobium sacchariphilum]|uniref:Uncharacterized protein n=1 Tax=Terrimicrobium sacchariphilum TaxID=690879 RepID=A0A146GDN1_TERSA|nr:hypothetical protein [Terrimicrobium sacchariphilum]GAT35262.1 hypothetical protein TSACC_3326 [Terrimicrobium sacchariphilum]